MTDLEDARRIAAANDTLGRSQRAAFWNDLAAGARGGAGGARAALASAAAVARELAVPRGPERGEGPPPSRPIARATQTHEYEPWAAVRREGVAALAPAPSGISARTPLHVAFLIPPFGFGSGGHEVVLRLAEQLERAGHSCTLWLDDPFRATTGVPLTVMLRRMEEGFGVRLRAPLHRGTGEWFGADVAVATGWQTVWALLRLPATAARAYLVNDDEPSFYPTSLESALSEETYAQDLFCIAGTEWMLERLRERHGVRGGWFDYTPSEAFRERPAERRDDTIVLYARTLTHRRAVGLAVMALEELVVRRGRDLRILMFGDEYPLPAPFDYEFLGLVRPERLAWTYSEATVGIALSMTNASLAPLDMMACGLPCVDLEGGACEAAYGRDAGIEFAPFDPVGMADAIDRLLNDPGLRERRRAAGFALTGARSWERAGTQVEAHLRTALRDREPSAA